MCEQLITCDTSGVGSGPSSGSGFGDSGLEIDETGHGIGVLERLRDQRDSGRFCDVTIHVDGVEFTAHRAVLAACSPYFETRLDGSRTVCQHLIISCQQGGHASFNVVLKYMYTGLASLTEDNVADVSKFAERFSMFQLRDRCAEFLHAHLSPLNCYRTRAIADGLGLTGLVRIIDAYIVANITDIAEAETTLDLPGPQLEEIVGRTMPLSEIARVQLLCRWVEHRPEDRRQRLMGMLATHVQWQMIGAVELSALLRSDACTSGTSSPLPSDWCQYCIFQSLKDSSTLPDMYSDQLTCLQEKFMEAEKRTSISKELEAAAAVDYCDIVVDIAEVGGGPVHDDGIDPRGSTMPGSEAEPNSGRPRSRRKAQSRRKKDQSSVCGSETAVTQMERQAVDDSTKENNGDINQPRRTRSQLAKLTKDSKVKKAAVEQRDCDVEGDESDNEGTFEAPDDDSECISPVPSAVVTSVVKRKRKTGVLRKAKCKQCHFVARSQDRLVVHVRAAHGEGQKFSCDLCEFSTSWNREFYRHMRQHFPGPAHKCDSCPFMAENIHVLLTHRMDHSDDRPFACDTCGARFKLKNNLVAHEKCHTGAKPFCCPVCSRLFATKGTMKQHVVTHSAQRPFLCDMCGFSTKFQSHLIAHKRIHTGDVYRCSVAGCSYSTPKRSQLACHARAVHLHIRSYVCSDCGRTFVERSHLVRHERTHLPSKPFSCMLCSYTSTRRDKLKDHVAKHHSSGDESVQTSVTRKACRRRQKPKPVDVLPAVDEAPENDAGAALSSVNLMFGVPVLIADVGLKSEGDTVSVATSCDVTVVGGTSNVSMQVPHSGFGDTGNLSCVVPRATLLQPFSADTYRFLVGDTVGTGGAIFLTTMPDASRSDASHLSLVGSADQTGAVPVTSQPPGIYSSLWLVNDTGDNQPSASTGASDLTSLNTFISDTIRKC